MKIKNTLRHSFSPHFVIPASLFVIPASLSVIPAKAGIQFLIFFFLLSSFLSAKTTFSGYLKSLDLVSNYKALSGNRGRLEGEWQDKNKNFDLRLVTDHEFLFGPLLSSQKKSVSALIPEDEFLDLVWVLNEKENSIWRHSFHRAYFTTKWNELEGKVGRQRIAWGQGRIWNPLDVINPYNPLSVEKDERLGSDSIAIKNYFSELSFLEAVYVPKKNFRGENSILLGRYRVNFRQMDWGVVGGKKGEELLFGFDSAAQIVEGSLRTEAAYIWGSNLRKDFFRAVLSYDYSFTNTLYLLGELYYNGIGENKKENYSKVVLKRGEQNFLGQTYFGFVSRYDFTPLWIGSCYGIVNNNDSSLFLSPKIEWKALTDLELSLAYHAFLGSSASEFGPLQEVAFFQIQWFY